MSNSNFGALSGFSEDLVPSIVSTPPNISSPVQGRLANNLMQAGNHLVVIDSAVANIDQLMAGIDATRVVVLDGDRNGIEQITEILAEYASPQAASVTDSVTAEDLEAWAVEEGVDALTGEILLDSLHIISHGQNGVVQLGNTVLDAEALVEYEEELAGWGEAIASEGDILLYGCDLAVGKDGLDFINELSELTGADVAASDDLTGAGGDWELEITTGSIEASVAVNSATQQAYSDNLARYNGREYVLTSGSQTWEEAQAEARSRGGNLVTINDAAEEAWLKQTFGQSEMWIGINDAAVDGQFEWASGEAVTYTNWAPGEPNNWLGDQDYGSMNFGSTKQWDDNGVSARFRGVIELSEVGQAPATEPIVYNGKEYSLTDARTWESAQAEARNRGGNLVTINDAAEEAWLKQAFGSEELWIGINDAAVDGQFRWANGEAVTYTNWAPGEPNNWQGDQDYGSMNFSSTKQWDDNGVNAVYRGIVEVAQTTQPPTPPTPPTSGTRTYNGSEYILTSAKTWEAAQAEARQKGGNLVTINDGAEENWIKQNYGSGDLWIGLNDLRSEGQFEWVSGEALTYTNWAPGEPNNGAGVAEQDYGRMNYGSSQQWDDHYADVVLPGLIEIKQNTPPAPPSNPGGLALEDSTLSIDEDAGSVRVNIVRSGGSDGTVTVDYRTQNNDATSGSDYQQRIGTLTFGPGEIEKTVSVPIINDAQEEGDEIFNFAIDNPGGGAGLLAPRTAQITIRDDDSAPSPPTPTPKRFRDNDYILTSGSKTWEEAQAEAQQRGGNLVTINSAEEEAWIKQNFSESEGYWIGFNDRASEGRFEWVSGQNSTYTNWAPGEPNNGAGTGEQDYVWMNYGNSKQWDDHYADITLRGLIEIGGDNSPPGTPNPPVSTTPTAQTVYGGLNGPTAIEWTPDASKMFIAEKRGVVKVAENGQVLSNNFINISDQVNTANDRGLLDIAIHPNFPATPYVYLLYSYDPPEVNGNSGLAGPNGGGNRAARLTRVTANANDGYRTAVSGSEVVLLGKNSTWDNFNGFVDSTVDFAEDPAGILPDGSNLQDFLAADSNSHSIGSVEFGNDGLLYISNGDGTSYNRLDPRTTRVQDVDNLSGKIIRINPINGQGLSSNPFYDGNVNSNRSKVFQLGLRNPFRFVISPNTGQPVIGDVGWRTWEEINVGGPGANFGWPYFEGEPRTSEYQNLPEAIDFYSDNPNVTQPRLSLNHNTGINAIIMGDIYDGDTYADKYDGDVFFNDVGRGIVSHGNIDSAGNISGVEEFARDARFVVQMRTGPDGDLYYVDLDDGLVGKWTFA